MRIGDWIVLASCAILLLVLYVIELQHQKRIKEDIQKTRGDQILTNSATALMYVGRVRCNPTVAIEEPDPKLLYPSENEEGGDIDVEQSDR